MVGHLTLVIPLLAGSSPDDLSGVHGRQSMALLNQGDKAAAIWPEDGGRLEYQALSTSQSRFLLLPILSTTFSK